MYSKFSSIISCSQNFFENGLLVSNAYFFILSLFRWLISLCGNITFLNYILIELTFQVSRKVFEIRMLSLQFATRWHCNRPLPVEHKQLTIRRQHVHDYLIVDAQKLTKLDRTFVSSQHANTPKYMVYNVHIYTCFLCVCNIDFLPALCFKITFYEQFIYILIFA